MKAIQLFLFILFHLFAMQVSHAQTTPQPATEVVVYRVKPGTTPQQVVSEANAAIKELPGFISRKVLQHPTEPLLYMDYVKWETMAQALAAPKLAEQYPKVMAFFANVGEVLYINHFLDAQE